MIENIQIFVLLQKNHISLQIIIALLQIENFLYKLSPKM